MIKKVLAVDNDPFMLESLKDVLPRDRYEVFTAEDSLSATAAEEPIERMAQLVLEVLDPPDAAALRCSAGEVIGAEKNVPRAISKESMNMGKHFETIMEVMHEGIIAVASTGRISCVNPAGLSLVGVHESRLLGTDFFDLFSETDKPKVLAAYKNTGESEPVNRKCLVHINGHQVMLRMFPIKAEEGVTSIIIIEDITEKRRMEKQLIQAKKRETMGTLVGGIAHNFNNLLMAIQGNISLLMLKKGFNHGDSDRLKTIEEYVKSGSKLTAQLIQLAKEGNFEMKPTDLNQIVEKSAGMFGKTNNEVRIHQKYQEGIWIVNADPGQLEQVFLNLYVNARKAMPGGGELFLETQNIALDENFVRSLGMNGRNFVKISVRDTGIGMDKETQERIFDPFFTTRKADMGTGLGLSTAYSTISDHNGMITVQSEKGEGAVFDIFLPISTDQLPIEKA